MAGMVRSNAGERFERTLGRFLAEGEALEAIVFVGAEQFLWVLWVQQSCLATRDPFFPCIFRDFIHCAQLTQELVAGWGDYRYFGPIYPICANVETH
jgi:hypothetical protein